MVSDMKFIIPLEGSGTIDRPFKPAFLDEAPPGIHYDLPNGVAIFDPDKAIKAVEDLRVDEKTKKTLLNKVKDAVKKLEKLAKEGKVKVSE